MTEPACQISKPPLTPEQHRQRVEDYLTASEPFVKVAANAYGCGYMPGVTMNLTTGEVTMTGKWQPGWKEIYDGAQAMIEELRRKMLC